MESFQTGKALKVTQIEKVNLVGIEKVLFRNLWFFERNVLYLCCLLYGMDYGRHSRSIEQ